MECLICGTEADLDGSEELKKFDCPRCGQFAVTGTAWNKLGLMRLDAAIVSGWIREQNALGITPSFDGKNVENLTILKKPYFRERAERYLLAAGEKCPNLDDEFNPTEDDLIARSYSRNAAETSIIIQYLLDEGSLLPKAGGRYRVSPKGHIVAEELRTRRTKSSQGFVAMWFATEMNPIYDEGLSIGVERAGYKSMRVDKKEHANKIDDEIIAEIRRSAFLVADFTGHRGGVYFEAGFAMGLGLPVIWTCRKDHIKDLHFDIRQYNCIDWTNAEELAERLQQRIEAMFGRGPVIDNQRVE